MNLDKLSLMKALYGNSASKTKVTKSYHKGRKYRVQQIFNYKGFVVKQIIHEMI